MEREIVAINPALNEMLSRGQLSGSKIADLIRVRAIVERFATKPYLSQSEVAELVAKFGTTPDVITYADYFQTELAGRYFQVADAEFSRIVDTVRFDLIAALKIFKGKPQAFFDAALAGGELAYSVDQGSWTVEQEEAAHLFVLCNYYRDLGLEHCVLSKTDSEWFDGFVQESGVAVG